MICRKVWQRPVQHLKIGCISSTAFGSVRPAAGEKGVSRRFGGEWRAGWGA